MSNHAMTFAEENMYIFNAFLDDLYIPYIMERKIRLYTPAEISSLFSAIEYELLCNYYKLIYYTVMTSAEARALRVSDIDIENRTIHIRQRIYSKARHSHSIKPLTNPQQARDIYLSDEAMVCVLDELRRREERCLKTFLERYRPGSSFHIPKRWSDNRLISFPDQKNGRGHNRY